MIEAHASNSNIPVTTSLLSVWPPLPGHPRFDRGVSLHAPWPSCDAGSNIGGSCKENTAGESGASVIVRQDARAAGSGTVILSPVFPRMNRPDRLAKPSFGIRLGTAGPPRRRSAPGCDSMAAPNLMTTPPRRGFSRVTRLRNLFLSTKGRPPIRDVPAVV
jgi:hypothetical protein